MKKSAMIGLAVVMALSFSLPVSHAQQQQAPGQSQGGWTCPRYGGQGMGPGRTAGQDGWICPWGGGQGRRHHMRGSGKMARSQQGQPVNQDQAKQIVEDHLRAANNPNLKLGDITDKGDVYEATILTKEGSLADKIEVNKNTGWFRSAY